MLDTGYFMKIAKKKKFIPNKKNQSVLIANISLRKTQTESPVPKNKLPPKFRATRYSDAPVLNVTYILL